MLLGILLSCSFPVDQRPSCAQYVACLAERDTRDGTQTDVARFDVAGECWGTTRGADLCDAACTSGLAFIADHDSPVTASCAP